MTEEWAEAAGGAPVPPPPLPPPPVAGGLLPVLRYTFRICLSERWAPLRLAAVFGLLLVSRSAGELAAPTNPIYCCRCPALHPAGPNPKWTPSY